MSETIVNYHDDLPFPDEQETCKTRRLRIAADGMEHDLFFLYVFLAAQDLSEEACEFLESHADDPIPFRRYR